MWQHIWLIILYYRETTAGGIYPANHKLAIITQSDSILPTAWPLLRWLHGLLEVLKQQKHFTADTLIHDMLIKDNESRIDFVIKWSHMLP